MFKFSSDYYLERAFEIGDVANQGAQGSGNLSGRLDAWVTLIDYVVLNPFGTIVPPQLVLDDSPDSQFIYFLTQGGLLLLVPFFILLLSIFLIAIRSRSNYFIAACIFLLISCLTFVSFNSFVMSLFWLIVGMSFKTNYDRKR
jgi:O-antigen ligase